MSPRVGANPPGDRETTNPRVPNPTHPDSDAVAHPPWLLLRDAEGGWLVFDRPTAIHRADRLDQVIPVVEAVESAVAAGSWAAGFLAYEAGPAFDPALEAHPARHQPLAWWGIFGQPRRVADDPRAPGEVPEFERAGETAPPIDPARLDWRPSVDRPRFRQAIAAIHRRISRGDTYQVNYTFPLDAEVENGAVGDPYPFFCHLVNRQRGARYAAYLDLGDLVIASASPELFVEARGNRLTARPMKGTARRGRHPEEDLERAEALQTSPKDRAENVMIVDMVRNDLGRIARPGTVRTAGLWELETYPTVHQLTSTVHAESDATFPELLRALFPCASITGAPKVATSHWIRQLEPRPRGVYTGSIGFLAPADEDTPRRLQLSVAIRTAVFDRRRETAVYGVGSGVVWDSRADAEYDECRAKALVLGSVDVPFALFETLLWRRRSGFFLRAEHRRRLLASAHHFGFALAAEALDRVLDATSRRLADATDRARVRIEVDRRGTIDVDTAPFPCQGRRRWRIALDDRPVHSADTLLFHKTTRRELYDAALARARARYGDSVDEVVLWNERGELTEGCRTNLVIRHQGQDWTPPVDSGLLPGTYRARLLARGRLREKVLRPADLVDAEGVFLINSLRGFVRTRETIFGLDASAPPTGGESPTEAAGTEAETSIQSIDPNRRSSTRR